MDRRQKRTRQAIFDAFTCLLEKKTYTSITVQEIIDAADIGRWWMEHDSYSPEDICGFFLSTTPF